MPRSQPSEPSKKPVPQGVISWDDIRIGSPCDKVWSDMSGDDARRFCNSCRKNVYNLADMSRAEAEATVHEHEGRLCVRLYKRTDGTLVTGDCVKARRHVGRIRKVVAASAAVMLTFGSVALAGSAVSSITPESELAEYGTFARKVQDTILDVRVKLGIDPEPVQFILGVLMVDPDIDFDCESESESATDDSATAG